MRQRLLRKDDLMSEAIKSINESLANKEQSLKEAVIKKVVQVINPKEISEFRKLWNL
tara:strand:+ start:304 stop:474 length:171 start_codon:yes stop_codon:yes gene_type:complete